MPSIAHSSLQIMIVDDEAEALALLKSVLQQHGYKNIVAYSNPLEARKHLDRSEVAVALLDLNMPDLNGQELLAHITHRSLQIPAIVVTADNQVNTVINCMRSGAVDYLVKPVSIPRLLASIASALEMHTISRELLFVPSRPNSPAIPKTDSILTCSHEMKNQLRYLEIVARSSQPILICGETGVGKELFSQEVHTLSGRTGQFISINVAGLDDLMFSDTLFGHLKGAFTGAMDSRQGMVKRAENGTLLLDEIGDLGESAQIKLLRLIQEKEYYPAGSDTVVTSKARLVLATNRDLSALVKEGRFRKDLYYRLHAHQVNIPPLRNRQEDIPLLFDHFLGLAAEEMGRKKPVYSQDLIELLLNHTFSGNVREMQAITFEAVARTVADSRISVKIMSEILSQDERVEKSDPSRSVSGVPGRPKLSIVFDTFPTLEQAENELILRALEQSAGNQQTAANLLGISRQTLYSRLQRIRKSIS